MSQVATESAAMSSEIFLTKYRKVKSIGKGSFGEAVLVRSKLDGKRYVVKAIDSSSMTAKEKRDVQTEIRILAAVNHPNIIRYHEHFEDGSLIFIIMEFADGGDLNSRIKEAKKQEPVRPFDPKLAMFWFLQICMALKYLHDNHILHRDLKTANIFLTSKNVVKLGDFGISTVLQNTLAYARTVCGTPYYFSPELCRSLPYNNKSDVWSLGVIFYEMLTLQRPFNARSLRELLKKILSGQFDPIPTSVPEKMRQLCKELLQINPAQRPSVNKILENTFVQESLQGLSVDLEQQAEKERMEFEAKQQPSPPKKTPPPTPNRPKGTVVPPAMSEREQMAVLRGMSRENMRAMLAKEAAMAVEEGQPPGPSTEQETDGHPDVDDDGEHIEQKKAIVKHSKEIVGKKKLGGHPEEFGDKISPGASHADIITLYNGESMPASDVRKFLEKQLGTDLLNSAMMLCNQRMVANSYSNADIQRELNELVGATHAHHSNAIAKLCVYESKEML